MSDENLMIRTTGLSLNFPNVAALRDVSINVDNGTVFGFLGPNGAGKTTTIKVLLGLLKPATGSALVMGYDTVTGSEKIRANCGVLLEHNGLYEMLSAEENLEYFARIWALSANERKARIKELLTHIGLWERRKEKIGNWSKGMKQKLAIIRCLLHRPKLIFLDEPTSGLDPVATVSLRDDLLGLVKNEGVSIFLTTHNLDEVEKLCDSAAIINRGQVLAMGALSDLKRTKDKEVYQITCNPMSDEVIHRFNLGDDLTVVDCTATGFKVSSQTSEPASSMVQNILACGVEVNSVNKAEGSLEDFYLSIIKEKSW